MSGFAEYEAVMDQWREDVLAEMEPGFRAAFLGALAESAKARQRHRENTDRLADEVDRRAEVWRRAWEQVILLALSEEWRPAADTETAGQDTP